MRLFKLITTLIILCLIGIFVFQNLEILKQSISLKYNLYLVKKAFGVKLYLLVLISLLVGFFIGLSILLKFHFQTRRQLKRERIEKLQVQAAAAQGPANSQTANSFVTVSPESGTRKEG
ncbi:MAG: hypothetical protein M1398_02410 [Deltaproteobacteria bacterium]|nr:hypothetical protein [Deltaproteobacteria bacterium]